MSIHTPIQIPSSPSVHFRCSKYSYFLAQFWSTKILIFSLFRSTIVDFITFKEGFLLLDSDGNIFENEELVLNCEISGDELQIEQVSNDVLVVANQQVIKKRFISRILYSIHRLDFIFRWRVTFFGWKMKHLLLKKSNLIFTKKYGF